MCVCVYQTYSDVCHSVVDFVNIDLCQGEVLANLFACFCASRGPPGTIYHEDLASQHQLSHRCNMSGHPQRPVVSHPVPILFKGLFFFIVMS